MTTADRQLGCIIGRRVGRSPADAGQLRSMGAAAYHQRRGLWIPEDELRRMNEINRVFAEQIGDRLYGKRKEAR